MSETSEKFVTALSDLHENREVFAKIGAFRTYYAQRLSSTPTTGTSDTAAVLIPVR